MPCKMGVKERPNKLRETARPKNPTKRHACIVQTHESTWKRLESTLPKDREDHIAEKGYSLKSHYNLMHKLIAMLQTLKIPDAKAAVDKEWEKLETLPAWPLDKMKSKKEIGHSGSTKREK